MTTALAFRKPTLGTLQFNVVDANGVAWVVDDIPGWAGSAGSTLPLTSKTRAHGSWRGKAFLVSKTLPISGAVQAPSPDLALAAADTLNAAASLEDTTLTVDEGLVRWMTVARQGEVLITWLTDRAFIFSIQMLAPDPRRFADALTTSTLLPNLSGGLTVPLDVPVVLADTGVSGACSLVNPGNMTGPVRIRIDGPVAGPEITHVGTGAQLTLAASLTLGSGEWLDIDMEAQTVLANGQSSRAGYLTQRGWSGFEAGGNTWTFTSAAYNASALMTVDATPAWL